MLLSKDCSCLSSFSSALKSWLAYGCPTVWRSSRVRQYCRVWKTLLLSRSPNLWSAQSSLLIFLGVSWAMWGECALGVPFSAEHFPVAHLPLALSLSICHHILQNRNFCDEGWKLPVCILRIPLSVFFFTTAVNHNFNKDKRY